jgi:RNA-directed DNA polymerase
LMRRSRHFAQCDIRKYFPTIDHQILKSLFRRLTKDRRVLGLMDLIVDHSNEQEAVIAYFPGDDLFTPQERRRGLPIGNLTSQWFANWYLTGFDHYVTSHLGVGGYVRYCDDFVLLGHDRTALSDTLLAVRDRLSDIRLCLKRADIPVTPIEAGLTFVGYRIWPAHRLVRKDNIRRLRRRVRWMRGAYAKGLIDWPDVKCRLDSWIGHARQADSERLLKRISGEWRFKGPPKSE